MLTLNLKRVLPEALMLLTCISLASGDAIAQDLTPPNYTSYQGQVKAGAGEILDPGAYDMEVTVYDAPTGGNRIWGPFLFDGALGAGHAAKAYVLTDGHFSVLLGPTDTLGRKLRDGFLIDGAARRFVQIRFGDLAAAQPVLPRQQLLSGSYALQAYQATSVGPLVNYGNSQFGLGINEPQAILDVNGDVRFRGNFQSNSLEAVSVQANEAAFSGQLSASNLTVYGNAVMSGPVTAQEVVLPNAQQITFTHSLYSGLSSAEATVQIPGANSAAWMCSLGGHVATIWSKCDVRYDPTLQWVIDLWKSDPNASVSCSANCVKL